MLAYVFWHVPRPDFTSREYERALMDFLADLASAPPRGLASCATYRISEVPWSAGRRGHEDWYFVQSSADLDALNEAAVAPRRWDVHAAVATKMEIGHGGLYRHLHGEEQPLGGERAAWLTRPRGIRYEEPLQEIINGTTGFLSCWRRQMVLGPGEEFVIIGTSRLAVSVPKGWQTRSVERTVLGREVART
jgi:hypothetical protein